MANHPSAEKRARQTQRRRARARLIKGKVRGRIRKVHELLEAGKFDEARKEVRAAESTIARAASKGVYKKTSAARMISRLMLRLDRAARAPAPAPAAK